jgi:transposase-like protein
VEALSVPVPNGQVLVGETTMPPDIHPLSEKYPLMDVEEFAAFKADLAAHGLKNPIWLFEGRVLDGRNRLRACLELGIEPVFAEFEGSQSDAAAFVDSQNLHRRHLSRAWRQQRVRELRSQGMSYRAIASQIGVDVATVHRDAQRGVADAPTESALQEPIPGVADATPEPSKPDPDPGVQLRTPEPPQHEPNPGADSAAPEIPTTSEPTSDPPRIRGRDGRSYRAQRPTAPKPKPAPKEKTQWTELAAVLSELAQKVETLVPTPEESERPWDLISSLEATAASLLRQAQRLRRRHHL